MDISKTAEILAQIAQEYYAWAKTVRDANKEDFPRYNEARGIGESLDKEGGFELMRKAHQRVSQIAPKEAWVISSFWNFVGQWKY